MDVKVQTKFYLQATDGVNVEGGVESVEETLETEAEPEVGHGTASGRASTREVAGSV